VRACFRLCSCLASALLLSAAPLLAQAPAFEPGLRWQWNATAGAPWIPRSAAFDASGELVLAGVAFQNPAVRLLSAAPFSGPFTWGADGALAGAASALDVALAPNGLRGWSLAQYPAPDAAHRRTELAGYDFLGAALSGALPNAQLAPSWRANIGATTAGVALLAAEGAPTTIVAAVFETSAAPRVVVTWLDAASGVAQRTKTFAATGLRALAASQNAERVMLATSADVYVLGSDGSVLHSVALSAATDAVALSFDGHALAYGVPDGLLIEREVGGAWSNWRSLSAGVAELATRVTLAADGMSAAVGWWQATSGVALRFEAWDLGAPVRLHEVVQAGAPGGLQNFPEVAHCARDGRHFAFGAWGLAGAEPELWLFEREQAAPLLSASLPGSVQALALSEDGARLAVAHKGAHANQFATTGGVRLYDTGARDVLAVEPALLGGGLALQARRVGANACVFVLGQAGAGVALNGFGGQLLIDPGQPLFLKFAPCGAQGLATWSFALPVDVGLLGQPAAVQAVFAMPTGLEFGATLARPLLL
jgi:hypothetical protein